MCVEDLACFEKSAAGLTQSCQQPDLDLGLNVAVGSFGESCARDGIQTEQDGLSNRLENPQILQIRTTQNMKVAPDDSWRSEFDRQVGHLTGNPMEFRTGLKGKQDVASENLLKLGLLNSGSFSTTISSSSTGTGLSPSPPPTLKPPAPPTALVQGSEHQGRDTSGYAAGVNAPGRGATDSSQEPERQEQPKATSQRQGHSPEIQPESDLKEIEKDIEDEKCGSQKIEIEESTFEDIAAKSKSTTLHPGIAKSRCPFTECKRHAQYISSAGKVEAGQPLEPHSTHEFSHTSQCLPEELPQRPPNELAHDAKNRTSKAKGEPSNEVDQTANKNSDGRHEFQRVEQSTVEGGTRHFAGGLSQPSVNPHKGMAIGRNLTGGDFPTGICAELIGSGPGMIWCGAEQTVAKVTVDGHRVLRTVEAAVGRTTNADFKPAQNKQWTRRVARRMGNKRGGAKRSQDESRYDDYFTAFFAKVTSASPKAMAYLAGRYEDLILLAKSHKDEKVTDSIVSQLGSLGWQCSASPAKQSLRAEIGTVAGFVAGVRRHIDNRPLSICVDYGGKRTPNPFLTGRMIVIEDNEIIAVAGYLEGGGL